MPQRAWVLLNKVRELPGNNPQVRRTRRRVHTVHHVLVGADRPARAGALIAVVVVREDRGEVLAPADGHGADVPDAFLVLVAGALRHLNNLPALSRHPLLDALVPQGDAAGSTLERAAALRNELVQAITRLAPAGPRPAPGAQAVQGGWLHRLVLHEAYVEDRPNQQVMQRYHLSESTFHRARRAAVAAVALDLSERGGAV